MHPSRRSSPSGRSPTAESSTAPVDALVFQPPATDREIRTPAQTPHTQPRFVPPLAAALPSSSARSALPVLPSIDRSATSSALLALHPPTTPSFGCGHRTPPAVRSPWGLSSCERGKRERHAPSFFTPSTRDGN